MRRIALAAGTATLLAALPATAGAWSALRVVADEAVPEGVGLDDAGRVTLLWSARPAPGPATELFAGHGRPSGRIAAQRLADRAVLPRLAAGPRGHAVAAWVSSGPGCRNPLCLFAAVKPPGGRFGAPTMLLSEPFGGGLSVAIGERGDAVVAGLRGVRQPRGIRASLVIASRAPGARTWRTQAVGDAGFAGTQDPALAVAPDGSAVVGWRWHSGRLPEAGRPDDPGRTYVATRSGRGRFGSPRLLYPVGAIELAAAMDRRGEALLAWQAGTPFDLRILSARRTPAGRWSAPRVVGPGVTPTLAADRGGRALLLWSRHSGSGGPANAETHLARRAPGRAFSPPLPIPSLGQYPAVALAPRGRAVVAWTRVVRADVPPEVRVTELRGSRLAGPGRRLALAGGRPHVAVNRDGARVVAFLAHRRGEVPWFRTLRVMIASQSR